MTGTPKASGGAGEGASIAGRRDTVISVSDLAALIDGALKDRLPTGLSVVGELSGFSDRTHWYFTLKDEEAVVSAVMFASAAAKCRFRVANGQRVVATGRVEFFAKQGRTQFYVTALEQVGMGELEMRLKALIEELRALGWLDAARKRALPRFPRRVAVITSKTGAALQDVLDTMRRRCPAVEALVCDVRVQGPGAGEEVAAMIDRVSRGAADLGIDAVIVTRGGGSIEDLWAFNERVVGEAVLSCSVPVVAAIGHETDTTLIELIADERAATPTQAAMRLTPDTASLLEQLGQLRARLASMVMRLVRNESRRIEAASRHPAIGEPGYTLRGPSQRLVLASQRLGHSARARLGTGRAALERLGARLARHEPRGLYAARRAAVEHALTRLRRALKARLDPRGLGDLSERLNGAWGIAADRRSAALAALERELAVVGPMSVLARGYSLTTRASDGTVLRSASSVRPGESLVTRLSDGDVRSTVGGELAGVSGTGDSGPAVPLTLPARAVPVRGRKRRGTLGSPDQLGLF